jgi:glycosidase
LIKVRKQYAALYGGDVVWLQNTAAEEVVSLLRKDAKDEFLVLINLSSHRATGSVELSNAEGFELVKISGRPAPVDPLLPGFSLNGYEWFIYHRTIPK